MHAELGTTTSHGLQNFEPSREICFAVEIQAAEFRFSHVNCRISGNTPLKTNGF